MTALTLNEINAVVRFRGDYQNKAKFPDADVDIRHHGHPLVDKRHAREVTELLLRHRVERDSAHPAIVRDASRHRACFLLGIERELIQKRGCCRCRRARGIECESRDR